MNRLCNLNSLKKCFPSVAKTFLNSQNFKFNLTPNTFKNTVSTTHTLIPKRTFSFNEGSKNKTQTFFPKSLYWFGFGAGSVIILSESLKRFALNEANAVEISKEQGAGDKKNFKMMNFIADVVEKAAPAVVYIEISGKHPFTGKTIAVSNGSGFIVRSDGLVITNAHVVGNSAKVKVRLNNGTQKIGIVQAVDPVSDLATIKIQGENLPTVNLGKSSELRPGEFVVAMGSPLQLSNTVTAGIVSSANRRSQDLGLHNKDINYIQTDANINFGNSGGPLVNLEGEAIGINTMMVTTGISFAIPSDYAREFLSKAAQLEEQSKSTWFKKSKPSQIGGRKYIGITMVTLTPDILLTYKVQHNELRDVEHGVLIYRVSLGSPADVGGVKPGDILTEINGKKINSSDDVYKAIDANDSKLSVKIIRGRSIVNAIIRPENVD